MISSILLYLLIVAYIVYTMLCLVNYIKYNNKVKVLMSRKFPDFELVNYLMYNPFTGRSITFGERFPYDITINYFSKQMIIIPTDQMFELFIEDQEPNQYIDLTEDID